MSDLKNFLYVWDCSARPLGTYGVVVAAVSDLWVWVSIVVVAAVPDLWGCCGCGLGLMGLIYGLWVLMGISKICLWDCGGNLMGTMGLLWLRCGTYGDLWGAVAAVKTFWGPMGPWG